jgi:CBS domain-containing protein
MQRRCHDRQRILRIKGSTLFTTTPDGSVIDAVKAMADNDIGSLVVMDPASSSAC